jgi:hypothetical protein
MNEELFKLVEMILNFKDDDCLPGPGGGREMG